MTRPRTYEVTVQDFPPVTYSATSPAKARTEAWRDYTRAYECTFKDFLRISRVRRCPVPADDGYGYVRRVYGVDPKIGASVRLVNEGKFSGIGGEIVYPGRHTASIHVVLDGHDDASIVHPLNIEFVQANAAPKEG